MRIDDIRQAATRLGLKFSEDELGIGVTDIAYLLEALDSFEQFDLESLEPTVFIGFSAEEAGR